MDKREEKLVREYLAKMGDLELNEKVIKKKKNKGKKKKENKNNKNNIDENKMNIKKLGGYFSLDIECFANGTKCTDRVPCKAVLVHYDQVNRTYDVLYNKFILPRNVRATLEEIHGIAMEDVRNAVNLETALDELRQIMKPSKAILVGQDIDIDIERMGLEEGRDFKRSINLKHFFRRKFNEEEYSYYSIRMASYCLLNHEMGKIHDPKEDALVSLKLFVKYCFSCTPEKPSKQLKKANDELKEYQKLCRRNKQLKDIWSGVAIPEQINGVCCRLFDCRKKGGCDN